MRASPCLQRYLSRSFPKGIKNRETVTDLSAYAYDLDRLNKGKHLAEILENDAAIRALKTGWRPPMELGGVSGLRFPTDIADSLFVDDTDTCSVAAQSAI